MTPVCFQNALTLKRPDLLSLGGACTSGTELTASCTREYTHKIQGGQVGFIYAWNSAFLPSECEKFYMRGTLFVVLMPIGRMGMSMLQLFGCGRAQPYDLDMEI